MQEQNINCIGSTDKLVTDKRHYVAPEIKLLGIEGVNSNPGIGADGFTVPSYTHS